MIGITRTPKGPGAGFCLQAWLERVSVLKSLYYKYRAGEMEWERGEQIKAAVC